VRRPTDDPSRPPNRHDQFLLEVVDALRPIADPLEVQAIVTRMLADHFGGIRALYAELDDGKEAIIHRDWSPHAPSIVGRYRWEHFISPAVSRAWDAGDAYVIEDVKTAPDLDESQRAAYEAIGCGSVLATGLKKNGRWVAGLGLHLPHPKKWRPDEKALLRDISERTWAEVQRAHSETALRRSEEKYRSLFTSIDEGFCVLELVRDARGRAHDVRFLDANPAFERQTGLLSATGRSYREMTGSDVEPHWLELHELVLSTGVPERTDVFSEPLQRWLEISVSRVSAGQPQLACVFKDISERKRAELVTQSALEREQRARAAAEEATALRDDFISVVSHELRTPISAILICSTALRSGAIPPERLNSALDSIVTSANLQHRLIDELLDIGRLTSGKMPIAVQHDELGGIIEAALTMLRPTAQARKVELSADTGGASVYVLVDRGRLHQVLWNVIGNAIKFSSAGGHVEVSLRSSEDAAVIEIKDDGLGISPSFLPHLFDRFRQADMGPSRSFGGLGLGLSIARELVELHGGTITAASEGVGHGATFRIDLPLGVADVGATWQRGASSPTASPPPALRGRRILVVEDDANTRAGITWLLESCGAEVVAAADGDAAREASALGARFDTLVCDLGLPTGDGCSLLQALREFPNNPLPALALTAYVRRHDRERALAAGFNAFLPKPIAADRFMEAVAALAG
jgi:PAS domain S-box-containing protein